MTRELFIGDPHVTVDEIEDAEKLFGFALDCCVYNNIPGVTILGDLHHNFTVINVKVTAFYREVFARFRANGIRVRALVGNHDMPGDGSGYPHALISYPEIEVIDKPTVIDGVLYVPYIPDPNLFIDVCQKAATHLVVCHQEFNGAIYDNGFYAPNGVDPSRLSLQSFVSGHIHGPQRFANVWYPGAPRWRTISDANKSRDIWLLTIEDGRLICSESFSTGKVCRQIFEVKVTEDKGFVADGSAKDDWRISVEGSAEFVTATVPLVKASMPWATIRSIIQDRHISVRESDGIPQAFKKYADSYVPQNGTPPEVLSRTAVERLYGAA